MRGEKGAWSDSGELAVDRARKGIAPHPEGGRGLSLA